MRLIRHHERQEKAEHPLHRIMRLEEGPESIIVETTDIHLPQRIGEALRHTFKGALGFEYAEETYFLRVHWHR